MAAQFARAPHRGVTSGPTQGAPNAALLIDFDNVTMGIRSDLSKELKHLLNSDIIKGKVAVQRAYADWRRYPQYIVPLAEASVDLIFAPAYGSSKKNATDIRLAIDALELVFTRPEIGTYILLSGDSDFSSLVLKLKEYGKYVIGVGIRESASDLLVQNCDEYYSYSILSGLTKEGDEAGERPDPWTLVKDAVRQMADQSDVMRSDRLKQVMLQLDPNFNEKDLGYSKFSKFLSDAVARNCLTLKKLDNGQWEVAPAVEGATEAKPEEESAGREDGRRSRGRGRDRGRDRSASRREETATASEAKAGSEKQAKEEAPEAGSEKTEAKVEPRARKVEARDEPKAEDTVEATGDPLTAAYDLLCRAVAAVAGSTGAAARDSDVKRRMLEFESGWDESTLGFSKFSRFLRQAHDAEVIDLRKVGNGTYEVVLPSGRASSEEAEPRGRKGSRTSSRSTRSEKSSSETAATKKSTASSKSTANSADAKAAAKAAEEKPAAGAKAEKVEAKAGEAEGTEAKQVKAARSEAKPAEAAKAEAEASTPTPAADSGSDRTETRSRSLGIGFRRGTRGRTMLAGPPPVLPGQTVTLPEENGKAAASAEAETKEPARRTESAKAVAQAAEEKPRSTRKSSRSKKTADKAAKPAAEKQAVDTAEKPAAKVADKAAEKKAAKSAAPVAAVPELAGLPTDAADVEAYLLGRYKGVGKKTAEALIEAFGAGEVFRTLHEEPERVREVLGARRTTTVLNAWQADLEQRRAEAAAVVEEAAPVVTKKSEATAEAGPKSKDGGQKKSGTRSRTRRGGRKHNKTKVTAGGD